MIEESSLLDEEIEEGKLACEDCPGMSAEV
jgi:hypothetical protein